MAFAFWRKKKTAESPEIAEPIFEAGSNLLDEVVAAPSDEFVEAPVEVPVQAAPKPVATPVVDHAIGSVTQADGSRSFAKRIRSLFSNNKFDPNDLESLEDILILADFGVQAASSIVAEVKKQAHAVSAQTESELKQILTSVLTTALTVEGRDLNLSGTKFPYVFLVVGVNGVGKTTTMESSQLGFTRGSGTL
jgi:fused signal recognition particle receptor